jgi:hypothetical protein
MRDVLVQGAAIVIASLVLALALLRAADQIAGADRYGVTTAGDSVLVLDRKSGQLQTFERSGDGYYRFVGADSRRLQIRDTDARQ